MSDFTNEDRETQVKTFVMLENHVKLSNERHADMVKVNDDHERRIRMNEKVGTKVTVLCSIFLTGITALIYAAIKKVSGS